MDLYFCTWPNYSCNYNYKIVRYIILLPICDYVF